MFDHPDIQIYPFEQIPLGQDIFLMEERWMAPFAAALIKSIEGNGDSAYTVGYYSAVSARSIGPNSIEMSWYPNTYDRFHEVRITFPRSAFIACVASWQYDYKPVVFVHGDWLNNLYMRSHSVFALIDAINVKKALSDGRMTRTGLVELRNRLDAIAASCPDVAFISFADSLLLKSNYAVGTYNSEVAYTYDPEGILRQLPAIRMAYKSIFGLDIYAVVTQGINEYHDDGLLHVSSAGNHISLNSLGLPFAQTQAIEQAARRAIKDGLHAPADVYLDETFYHSLRFKRGFDKNSVARFPYKTPMAAEPGYYFPVTFELLADHLVPTDKTDSPV